MVLKPIEQPLIIWMSPYVDSQKRMGVAKLQCVKFGHVFLLSNFGLGIGKPEKIVFVVPSRRRTFPSTVISVNIHSQSLSESQDVSLPVLYIFPITISVFLSLFPAFRENLPIACTERIKSE